MRPIKTDKHEILFSALSENASTQKNITLATGVQSADKDNAGEVETGSHIKWIYMEINIAAEDITTAKILHWTVSINPTGAGNVPTPATGYSSSRSRILKRGMEMLPKDVGTVFKRIFVVKIPRKWQRMAEGQKIAFNYIATSTAVQNLCGFAIYKEIY